MRDVTFTRDLLSRMTEAERESCIGAIAGSEHSRRMQEREEHPYIKELEKQNIRDRATGYAAERLLTGYPPENEVQKYEDRARAEITERKKNGDWYYGVNVLRKVELFGEAMAKVPDEFIVPHQSEIVSAPDRVKEVIVFPVRAAFKMVA